MKDLAVENGVPVAQYARLQSPSCLLSFINKFGLPVVVKPAFGSASIGLSVIRSNTELREYLSNHFLQSGDRSGRFDMVPGELIVEAFLGDAPMYHVNGLVRNGKIVALWPFAYLSTNLEFASNSKSYGNISIPSGDGKIYHELKCMTEQVLSSYCLPQSGAFHMELFHLNAAASRSKIINPPKGNDQCYFALCEIAMRRPGGSISPLIEMLLDTPFAPLEMRFSLGLPTPGLENAIKNSENKRVGDLLVPKAPNSKIVRMPLNIAFPVDNVSYYPIAKVGQYYSTFSVATMNTAARFLISCDPTATFEMVASKLFQCDTWFRRNLIVQQVDRSSFPSSSNKQRTSGIVSVIPRTNLSKLNRGVFLRHQRAKEQAFYRKRALVVVKPSVHGRFLAKTIRAVYGRHLKAHSLVLVKKPRGLNLLSIKISERLASQVKLADPRKSNQIEKYNRMPHLELIHRIWRRVHGPYEKAVKSTQSRPSQRPHPHMYHGREPHREVVSMKYTQQGKGNALLRKLSAKVHQQSNAGKHYSIGASSSSRVTKGKQGKENILLLPSSPAPLKSQTVKMNI
jgi:hypothetical protein